MAESAGKRRRSGNADECCSICSEAVEGGVSSSGSNPNRRDKGKRRRGGEISPVDDICAKLIRAANEVQSEMGYGYSEAVYEKALVVEIQEAQIGVVTQQLPITYYYRGHPVGSGRMDLLITHPSIGDRQIVLELKIEGTSSTKTINDAIDQTRGYLRSMPVDSMGIVIVFPKVGKHSCMCVKIAQGATPPYISPATLAQTYALF